MNKHIENLKLLLETHLVDDTIPENLQEGAKECLRALQNIVHEYERSKDDREVTNIEEE